MNRHQLSLLLRSRLMGDSAISFGSKIFGAVLSYAMLIIFARLMTAENYGQFGVAFNASIVVSTVIGLGLPVAAMRIYPTHKAKAEAALAKGFINSSYKTVAITGVAFAFISLAYGLLAPSPMIPAFALIAVAILALLTALTDLVASILRAQGSVAWSSIPRDIGWRLGASLLAVIIVLLGFTLTNTLALATCIVTLGAVAAFQIRKSHALTRHEFGTITAETNWRRWLKPAVPLWASSVAYALIQQADVVTVGGLLGPAAAAPYFAAQKTAALLSLAMIAGGQVAAPLMAAAFHTGNMGELRRVCRLLALGIAAITVVGFVFLMLSGGLMLRLFDPAFVAAYPILLVFAASVTIDAVSGPTAYLMQMTSLEKTYLVVMAICYALVVTLQFALVPHFGAIAAAISSACGVIAWNVAAIIILRRKLRVDPSIAGLLWPVKDR